MVGIGVRVGIGVNVGGTVVLVGVGVRVGIGVNVGGIEVSVGNNVAIVVGTGVLVKSGTSVGTGATHVDNTTTAAMIRAVKVKRRYINASQKSGLRDKPATRYRISWQWRVY